MTPLASFAIGVVASVTLVSTAAVIGMAVIFRSLTKMSDDLSKQITDAQAETNAALDAIQTDVTEIGADVDTLLAGMSQGSPVTQAMVDGTISIRDRVAALKSGLDAVNAKVPTPEITPPIEQAQATDQPTA